MSAEVPAPPLDFAKQQDGRYSVSIDTYADIAVGKQYIAPGLTTGRWEARWQGRLGWGKTRTAAVQDLIERHRNPKGRRAT